jgi:regulatory protein
MTFSARPAFKKPAFGKPAFGKPSAASKPVQAYSYALRLLAMKDCSEQQLETKLRDKLVGDAEILAAVERLKADGYLDNARFAASKTRSLTGRGKGPRFISGQLKQAGVSQDDSQAAAVDADTDWLDQAKQALMRKFRDEPIADKKDWARRARFLLARGFTNQIACKALKIEPNEEC